MSPNKPRSVERVPPNQRANPQALKYYNPELQEVMNDGSYDSESYKELLQNGRKLHDAYLKQVRVLAPRMSKSTFLRFSNPRQPLFDSDLLEFAFGDSLVTLTSGTRRRILGLSVRILFRSFDEKKLHTLRYGQVASLNASIPTERWFEMGHGRIDSLLADELTEVNEKLMQHTFLFASGTMISIQFGSVTWRSAPNK